MFDEKDCHVIEYEDGKVPVKILVPKEVKDIAQALEVYQTCLKEDWISDNDICDKLCPLKQRVYFTAAEGNIFVVTNICGLARTLQTALEGECNLTNLDKLL